jgi:hypothetical protein
MESVIHDLIITPCRPGPFAFEVPLSSPYCRALRLAP